MFRSTSKLPWLYTGLALLLMAAYTNHFQNGFHFDDFHTVTENPFIRDLHNIPRFFADPTTFSTLPDHATWRPITSVSLALDYWAGKGLKPFYFQLSTFLWFEAQVILMFHLFLQMMNRAHPDPSNSWTSLAAAACYGLHPVNAETVNYVVQRADLFSALGPVASLLWFIAKPSQRRYGWYLIPAVISYLAKAPALIFPVILFVYILLFETDGQWRKALRATAPALIATAAAAILTAHMTPASYIGGATSATLYRLTQPWVALHYFKSFFLPTELSADTDWGYVADPLATDAVAGYVFVVGLLVLAWRTSRTLETRPIAFGILWFLLALLPTALMPLAEVTNDHRMFFPYVGLALAVFWAWHIVLFRRTAGFNSNLRLVRGSVVLLVLILGAEAAGTRTRNEVWRTDESLWRDVTFKSPRNGRGLMNYGLTFMERGDYATALSYFQRAQAFTPNYWSLEVNLAIANGGLNKDSEAEQHFLRAVQLEPGLSEPSFYYARWLSSKGRTSDAITRLEPALQLNRLSLDARHLLVQLYQRQGNAHEAERLTQQTLQLAPGDDVARRLRDNRTKQTPESYLDASLHEYQAGNFEKSIEAAKKALELRPGYAEAYNNISAAYNSMAKWDEGIRAASEAVRLKPDYQLAKNNLAWAISQKQGGK